MSRDLLEHARELIGVPEALSGVWPRAVAFLTRQALEEGLAGIWQRAHPGMEDASWSTQLACLDEILTDRAVVGEVRMAWASLSRACHHHHYELEPTGAELERWIRQTEVFISAISEGDRAHNRPSQA